MDKKAPAVSCGSADNAWHANDVTIGCTATDGGSGVDPSTDESFSLSTNVASGTETANAQTNSKDVSDALGHTTTAGPIGGNKVDKKAPAVSCGSADNAWHADNVSIACSASDGGSGIPAADESFSLSTTVAAGEENANASTGSRDVTDGVGHKTTGGPIGGNKIDKKAPTVTCPTPTPTFSVGQSPANLTGSASDGGSRAPDVCDPELSGYTSGVVGNPKSVTLSAQDNVGHVTNQPCAYNVLYGFAGFFQPIDNDGMFNKAKAGSSIPVKFSLDGPPQPGSNTPGLGRRVVDVPRSAGDHRGRLPDRGLGLRSHRGARRLGQRPALRPGCGPVGLRLEDGEQPGSLLPPAQGALR